MSGLEFARAVRANPIGISVPILMVTTRGAREDIVTAVEAGVNNYILKPFTPSVLKDKIDRLLAGLGAAA
jgi:two-component system chemotaxis response regulator CheY